MHGHGGPCHPSLGCAAGVLSALLALVTSSQARVQRARAHLRVDLIAAPPLGRGSTAEICLRVKWLRPAGASHARTRRVRSQYATGELARLRARGEETSVPPEAAGDHRRAERLTSCSSCASSLVPSLKTCRAVVDRGQFDQVNACCRIV